MQVESILYGTYRVRYRGTPARATLRRQLNIAPRPESPLRVQRPHTQWSTQPHLMHESVLRFHTPFIFSSHNTQVSGERAEAPERRLKRESATRSAHSIESTVHSSKPYQSMLI